ncbi:MAG: hypothetical protein QXH27_04665 [Candidatus Micrarchaeia archaeon]
MKKKKIKLSPQQIADLVNQALIEDSLVLAATQRGVGGIVESSEVENRMRKFDERLLAAKRMGKRRVKPRAARKRRIKRTGEKARKK